MAIEVNGKRFVTLADEFFVNGAKVYEAWANGVLVYPEDTYSELLDGLVEQPIHISDGSCGFELAVRHVGIGVTNYYLSEQFTGEFVGTVIAKAGTGGLFAVMGSAEPFTATRHWQSGKYDFDTGSKTITVDEYGDFSGSNEFTYDGKKVYYLYSNFQTKDWYETNPEDATWLSGEMQYVAKRVAWVMVYERRR